MKQCRYDRIVVLLLITEFSALPACKAPADKIKGSDRIATHSLTFISYYKPKQI